MELSRRTIQRMILRKSGDTTVINQGSEGGGGGSQPSVALGPLLTSLNSESMPSAEGYLHWTGSAWAFDTPTGGDPVDLTPYALKTWVQDNFAYKNDLVNFITKTEADGYYAALNHTHANYLPLSAGANKALTGSLYFSGNSGINWSGGVGMLACTPESGWTGISSSQWGVGALSAQGVIRSNANDILHYRNGANYKIWDAYNFTPSDYLPLTGGTVESLTVTNGLDADSITVGSIVNSDTLAEYLDADAMQTWGDGRYLKLTGGTMTGNLVMNGASVTFGPSGSLAAIGYSSNALQIGAAAVAVESDGVFTFNGNQVLTTADKAGLFTQLANYDGALQITIGGTQKSLTIAYANAAGSANTAVNADKLDNYHASDFALASSLGNYLPLTGGTVNGNLNVKGTIQAQDSNGNNKVIIYGTTGNIRAEKVYIGGSTSGYEAATHDWVTGQGYQANIIESVKVNGTALTPTNKAVDIPAATSDGVIFGVVAIGTGFTFDEGRLCVDTSTFATRTWADGRYLPLSAGPNKALTDSLYITGSNGIQWAGSPGVGMLCYMPSSGWTGISPSQWGVGATSAQGVIRSNANDILHYRNGTNYKIWDAYNFTPSDYLPLTGGTVESLTVTNGLDADSITVGSIVNSDTLAEYLDADAMQTWLQQQGYITQTTADGRYIKGVSVYGSSLTPDANRVVNIPYADINTPGVIQIGTGLLNSEGHTEVDTSVIASKSWANGQFVTVVGVNGENLTYTKNGSTTNLTVRFAMRTMGFKRMYVTGSQIANANTMTVGGVEYALLSNYASTDLWENMPSGMSYGNVLQLTSASSLSGQLAWDSNDGVTTGVTRKLYWRSRNSTGWGTDDWHTIAFQDWVQSWVNGRGFASNQDLYDLGTLVTTGYLPLTAGTDKPLTGILWMNNNLVMANPNHTTNDDSTKIAFYTNKNYPNISPYIQAINENNYGRKRLSVFQKNVTDWDTPQVEVFTINPDGNVGIGTTTPTAKLDVNGTMRMAGALYGAGGYIDLQYNDEINRYGGNLFLQHRGGGITGTGTGSGNTGNLIMCAHGGNVGIGTGSPDSKLHVTDECHFASGAKFNNICIEVDNSIAASGRGSEINNYNGRLLLQYNSSTNCSICYGGGNVGIGTASPAYKLDVNGNTGVTGSLDVSIELSVGDVTDGGVWLSDSALGVWTMSGTTRQDTELMSLASGGVTFSGDTIMTGKLAVGTTAFDGSNAKLQVGGNMFATGSITSKSNAGNVSLGNGNISATNLYISTVVFGNSNNDAAFYVSNGHIWARNSSGTSTMIV